MAAAALTIDQATKGWAYRSLHTGGDQSVISGVLNFVYAENPGIAFSMFDDRGESGRWVFTALALAAAALVFYFIWRTPLADRVRLLGLSVILAGILGNAISRLRLGYVIDFIDVQFGSWHYPVFNVADCLIWIGAGLLLIDLLIIRKSTGAT